MQWNYQIFQATYWRFLLDLTKIHTKPVWLIQVSEQKNNREHHFPPRISAMSLSAVLCRNGFWQSMRALVPMQVSVFLHLHSDRFVFLSVVSITISDKVEFTLLSVFFFQKLKWNNPPPKKKTSSNSWSFVQTSRCQDRRPRRWKAAGPTNPLIESMRKHHVYSTDIFKCLLSSSFFQICTVFSLLQAHGAYLISSFWSSSSIWPMKCVSTFTLRWTGPEFICRWKDTPILVGRSSLVWSRVQVNFHTWQTKRTVRRNQLWCECSIRSQEHDDDDDDDKAGCIWKSSSFFFCSVNGTEFDGVSCALGGAAGTWCESGWCWCSAVCVSAAPKVDREQADGPSAQMRSAASFRVRAAHWTDGLHLWPSHELEKHIHLPQQNADAFLCVLQVDSRSFRNGECLMFSLSKAGLWCDSVCSFRWSFSEGSEEPLQQGDEEQPVMRQKAGPWGHLRDQPSVPLIPGWFEVLGGLSVPVWQGEMLFLEVFTFVTKPVFCAEKTVHSHFLSGLL